MVRRVTRYADYNVVKKQHQRKGRLAQPVRRVLLPSPLHSRPLSQSIPHPRASLKPPKT